MRDIFRTPPTAGLTRCAGRAAAAPPSPRAGFTLVEVLMVILIISMLIALLVPAVQAARLAATKASIKIDVNDLAMAMEKFRTDYGTYPPDRNFTDPEIETALRKIFPRRPALIYQNMRDTIKNLNEAETLVLWLGGRWDGTKMTGFNADPTGDPFAAGGQRTTPVFAFQDTRLLDRQAIFGFPEYYPPNINLQQAVPYVYFASRPNGEYGTGGLPQYVCNFSPTTAVPYRYKQASAWMNPTKFQIISAGIDNDYGAVANKVFPLGTNYSSADNDNIVNFTERTIGDAQQ